jgi:SAM-dependent methyltransferase
MASGTEQGYTTEVAYLRTFSDDLSPGTLRLVAALNGLSPPPARGFDYLELGSGNGDTTVTLAAANPDSRFVGVDINPEHVAFANGLKDRGRVVNVRFLELDFEALRTSDLPAFDFITAHGVLSWISPAKRKAMIEVASAKLEPGGLLYVSYNALPGWAAIEPLRRLLLDGGAVEADGLSRAQRGLGLAAVLRDAGAAYFTKNPTASAMLDTMMKAGLPYVFHEYFQPDWHPMYFADVAREMASADLHFLGQLPLPLNYRELALPPALSQLARGVTERAAFESLKDFAVNETFRRDVYVKGAHPRSDLAAEQYLDTAVLGSLLPAGKFQRELVLPHEKLPLTGPLFDALIPAVAQQATTIAELARRAELAPFGLAQVREGVLRLALSGQVVPMRRPTQPAKASGQGMFRFHLPHDRAVVEQRLSSKTPLVLAVPAAGTGLVLSVLQAVCLRLLTSVLPEDRPAWIRRFVERQPLKLHVADREVDGVDERASVLQGELTAFCDTWLPKLLELEVLEQAP